MANKVQNTKYKGHMSEALCLSTPPLSYHHIVRQQYRTKCDARVGDVKSWPVIAARMHDDEVDDVTETRSIGQVAENAGKQQ